MCVILPTIQYVQEYVYNLYSSPSFHCFSFYTSFVSKRRISSHVWHWHIRVPQPSQYTFTPPSNSTSSASLPPKPAHYFLLFPADFFSNMKKKVSTLILMYRCIQHSAIHPYTIHNYTCWRKHRHKQPTNTTTKTTKNKRKTPE